MTDLRDLVDPLLSDPPHPPPPLDELERRVDRRRQRRARAIGACSIVAVVLVAATILALPRDRELQVGGGSSTTTTSAPPPIAASPIQLVVTPGSAPLDADRTIEIRNGGTEPYDAACQQYGLVRWDGSTWLPVATATFSDTGTWFAPPTAIVDLQCAAPDLIPPGSSRTTDFAPDRPRWHLMTDGSTPPPEADPLPTGWYELRAYVDGVDDPPLGRFEITDSAEPGPTATSLTTSRPEDDAPVSIDLYPLDLAPGGEVLPNTMFVVDQDTIALAWTGPCNRPADHVTFDAHDGEIELRLHVGTFVVVDCTGEPDNWVVTFDVPFTITDRVRLVARADGTDGQTEPVPGSIFGALGGDSRLVDPMATSFRVVDPDPSDPKVRNVRLLLPSPLVDAGISCDTTMSGHNDVMVPQVWVDASAALSPPCSQESLTMPVNPGSRILGPG